MGARWASCRCTECASHFNEFVKSADQNQCLKKSVLDIPIQAKIITICDIFDALSASDRPYKKAVPVDRALDMLQMSVRDHELDADLFGMFVEGRVFSVLTH